MNKFLIGILIILMVSVTGCGDQEETQQTPQQQIEEFNPPPNPHNPLNEVIIETIETLAKTEGLNNPVIKNGEYKISTVLCGRDELILEMEDYTTTAVKSKEIIFEDGTTKDIVKIPTTIPLSKRELREPPWKETHQFKVIGIYEKSKDPYKTMRILFKYIGDEDKCPPPEEEINSLSVPEEFTIVIDKDYIIQHLKVGMGQDDVRNLLGSPHWEGTDHEFELGTWDYLYAKEGYSSLTEEEKYYGEIDEDGLKSGDVKLQLSISFNDNKEIYSYSIFTKEGYYNVIDGDVYEGEF